MLVAMCGFETIQIAVPNHPRLKPHAVGKKHGGKRKMTPSDNTSISAIAAMYHLGPDDTQLCLYHNEHAHIPLDAALFHKFGVKQFYLVRFENDGIAQWEEYKP